MRINDPAAKGKLDVHDGNINSNEGTASIQPGTNVAPSSVTSAK
jgi:hypothetical protein